MNVLALVTDGFGARGGIARYNGDLLTALTSSPTARRVVVMPRSADADAVPPRGIEQMTPALGRLDWALRAWRLARSRPFDVVFCGHLHLAPVAASIARALRKPMWLQVHGIEAWSPRSLLVRAAVERASLVTAVSRFTRSRLLSWSAIEPQRVRVLPNTTAEHFAPRPRRDDLVSKYGLAGRKVILTIGRLSPLERYKGHDRIIRALPEIASLEPRTSYLIAGSGDDQPRLEALCKEAGVIDRVCFAGQIPDSDLADHYALADVFAMPSTGEGFGIVFLEAARCGLPVIGGGHDGSADALADGAIGRCISPDNQDELVNAVMDAFGGRLRAAPDQVARFSSRNFTRHVDELVGRLR